GYNFLFDPAYERVDEINLNEAGADPTYLRPSLSFETYAQVGLPCSIVFPLHIIRNNSSSYVRVFVEQPDRHLLRRVGLDDNGAFYKVYSDLSSDLPDTKPDEQVERKITRLDEDNSDLMALRTGLNPNDANRGIYLFDNVNIPAVIDYLAVCVLVHENDHTHKNYFLYRDTNRTGEWMFIPWDKDLSFGLNSGISGVIADQDWPGDPDRSPSHPFFGSRYHQKVDYQWNRLFDAIYSDPTSRQMYLRRLRTLMDTFLQAPGTSADQLYYEKRINELVDLVSYNLNSSSYLNEVNKIKSLYLPVRRTHLYVNHLHGSTWPDDPAGIPEAQPAQFSLQIGTIEFNPASWNQDEEYIEIINPNAFAVDISGWKVTGGISHTFAPGTVIPAAGTLYITPNAIAFRNRTTSPTGGQHLFVQGNYSGHLSSWGETIEVRNAADELVATKTYEGNPSDAQRYLRITELMYHPSAFSGVAYADDEYEYVELTNTASIPLSLAGTAFTAGLQYAFADDILLAPGEYLVLAKNPAAFAARYSVPQGVQVLGGYEGQLSNSGDTVKLDDQTHSTILEFTYNDKWYTITDGQGFSLVFGGDLNGSPDLWNIKASWRASTVNGGSPGEAEQGLASDTIVINEILAHSHSNASDWIELYNTTDQDISIGGWFLTDDNTDMDTIRKYEIPADTLLPGNGYLVFYQESSFGSESQPLEKRFALSEGGETVYLYSGRDGLVTGTYYTRQAFGASETAVAFGRHILSDGMEHDFTAMSENTPGDDNAYPKVGPIVISEILYHPPVGGVYDKDEYEFIELHNITESPVALYGSEDSLVPWQINDGVQFTFPLGVTIPAGQRIVVVKNIAAFQSRYPSVPTGKIFGPYDGKLDNAGEAIELALPGDEEFGVRYYIRVDRVNYSDGSHPEET
ncbi:MAG: lamin tail domain-containing protein, partial [Sedimentisphaerales bacterium]|nr:lamin tail domain-containing protein [Sedimentisphaerales bacterium]